MQLKVIRCALCGVQDEESYMFPHRTSGGKVHVCGMCDRVLERREQNIQGGDPLIPNFAVWKV